jgi:hypothetical protein
MAGKNAHLAIKGKGTILIQHKIHDSKTGTCKTSITSFEPVFYVPGMNNQLMSSGQLLQTVLQSKSDRFGTVFKDELGLPMLLAHVKSILQPTVQIVSMRIVHLLPESKVAQCPDYHLWHQHFCHPSDRVLSHVEDACIDGPKVTPPSNTPVCPGCTQGKMHQKPFGENPKCATEVIEHVHSDLFELPVMSYHKFKWVMTLLDNYSSFAHVVLLRSKSEAAPKMVELLTMLMNQRRKCIKCITSD